MVYSILISTILKKIVEKSIEVPENYYQQFNACLKTGHTETILKG